MEIWDCSREEHQRHQPAQNPSSIEQSSRVEKSCRIVSAVLDCYIPSMKFTLHRQPSRRHTPLWVLLLGMRQSRVMADASDDADVVVCHHRWKRSLRAPMVFRDLRRLMARRGSADSAVLMA